MELAKRQAHFYRKHTVNSFCIFYQTVFSVVYREIKERKKKKQQLNKLLLDTTFNTGVKVVWCYAREKRKNFRGSLPGELNLLVERKFIDRAVELFKELETYANRLLLDVNNSAEKWSELK